MARYGGGRRGSGYGARVAPQTERRPGGPAGPYPGESSNPAVRSRARRERSVAASRGETPVVPYSPPTGPSSKRAARYAAEDRAKAAKKRKQSRVLKQTRQHAAERRKRNASESKVKARKAKGPIKPKPAPKLPPTAKPPRFEGRKTAGTPTQRSLLRAKRTGTLKVNQRGYLTTPAVRKTTRTVKGIERKAAKRRSRAPLPGLDREQAQVARTVLRRGEKARATSKEKLAAIETGLVESNLRNLSYGDLDSQGFRQERTSIYGTGPQGPTNVPASADRLYRELRTDPGTESARTAGELAQAAQASAFPERYDERRGEAKAIIRAYNKGKLKPAEQRKLSKARRKAADLGLKGLTKGKQQSVPKKVLTRFKAAQAAAKELEKADLPYVWGGGHGDPQSRPTGGGLDCSGAVSYVLNKMGALKGSLVSGEMGTVLKPGPGAVTVFYNPTHTFMRIGNRYFGTSASNEGGGAGFIEGTPDDLSKYSVGHVPGLGKRVAVAMGVPLTGGGAQSFPGMSLSASGTTATIESGSSTTKGKPGFSSKPIRLTQAQKARRTYRRLREAGVGTGKAASAESETSPTLQALERKYGVKTG